MKPECKDGIPACLEFYNCNMIKMRGIIIEETMVTSLDRKSQLACVQSPREGRGRLYTGYKSRSILDLVSKYAHIKERKNNKCLLT